MTIAELQREFLSSGSKHIAPEDFFILLAHAIDGEKTFLLSHPEHILDTETESRARESFSRRLSHEPVAYITGHKEFYGLDFSVTKDTLIPRPETELLVELALDKAKQFESELSSRQKVGLVDIGTGSGNIIISIASALRKERLRFIFSATDISDQAIVVAKKNAERHDMNDIIRFYTDDLLESGSNDIFSTGNVIVTANLPYLAEEIYQASHDEVKKFEPRSALLSGQAGLEHYYRLFNQIKGLSKTITIFLEISPEQAPLLEAQIPSYFPKATISVHQDLSGRDRIVEICLCGQ